MKQLVLAAALLVFLASTTESQAQLTVGLTGGQYMPQGKFADKDEGNAGDGLRIGAHVGVKWKKIAIRIDLDNTEYGENESIPGNTVEHKVLASVITVRYHLMDGRFSPFISGYGGIADYTLEDDFFKAEGTTLLNYGGGVGLELKLIGSLSVEASALYNVVDSKKKKFKLDGLGKFKFPYAANSIGVNVGVNYRFSFNPLSWLPI